MSEETLYTIAEVAKRYRVSYETLRRMIHSHQIAAFRVRGQWRITQEEVERIFDKERLSDEQKGFPAVSEHPTTDDTASPQSPPDVRQVITCLAIGLLRQDDAIREGTARPVTKLDPYLQWGWDKLSALCYSSQVPPPRHLPDLVALLHRPIEQWEGIGSLFEAAALRGPMMAYGAPSELCIDLDHDMHLSSDPERELQDTPFKEILAICKKGHMEEIYNAAEQYIWARQFVVEHPYLPDGLIEITRDLRWEPRIRQLLRHCYEPVPRACWRPGRDDTFRQITRCPRCGWPLLWSTKGHTIAACYSDLCSRLVSRLHDPRDESWETVTPEAVRTTRGIQFSVVGPEIPLLALNRQLQDEYHLHCDLWPAVDAHDLTVWLSADEPVAVDMKDHANPVPLAVHLSGREFPPTRTFDPTRHTAFYVFPKYRNTPGYLHAFLSNWVPPSGQQVRPLFADEFLRLVAQSRKGKDEDDA